MTIARNIPLDIFRGLIILNMMFVDAPPDLENIYYIFVHSPWEGITIADLAFPGFVFAMGASLAFSQNKKIKKKDPSHKWLRTLLKRTSILFSLGIIFNVLPSFINFLLISINNIIFVSNLSDFFHESINNIRILGVLQRLALVFFFTSLIIRIFDGKHLFIISFILLLISSIFVHLYSPLNPFYKNDNLSIYLDISILGNNHILYSNPPYEPEGIWGTINSIVSMILGFKSANLLIKEEYRKMLFLGTSVIFLGGLWSIFDIISKILWSSPYTLLTTGFDIYLLMLISVLYKKYQNINKFFYPILGFGRNPIFFYLTTNFILILLFTLQFENKISLYSWIYSITIQGFISQAFSSSLFAFIWCLLWFPIAYYFHKKNIVIKI